LALCGSHRQILRLVLLLQPAHGRSTSRCKSHHRQDSPSTTLTPSRSNFFSLRDKFNQPHYFVSMGTEGGNISSHPSNHWSLFNEGTISLRLNGSVVFTPNGGGATDWGLFYAQTSFLDTKHDNRRVQWGWAPEDILELSLARQQGFQGAFGLPRELFAHVTKGLWNTKEELEASGVNFYWTHEGTYAASTLGMKPLEDVVWGLRQGAAHHTLLPSVGPEGEGRNNGSLHMEFEVNISGAMLSSCRVGVYVAASTVPPILKDGDEDDDRRRGQDNEHEWTTIHYDPSNHTIIVDRHRSTTLGEGLVATEAVQGSFAPYTLVGGRVEDIRMRVFLDGSLLEVYVNDRFALTTRIYPTRKDSIKYGTWNPDICSEAVFSSAESWVGTRNVWLGRPANSSGVLL